MKSIYLLKYINYLIDLITYLTDRGLPLVFCESLCRQLDRPQVRDRPHDRQHCHPNGSRAVSRTPESSNFFIIVQSSTKILIMTFGG